MNTPDEHGAKSNEQTGQYLYAAGDTQTRDWFHRQWKAWPIRVDDRLTTNGSLHYGGVKAYRIEHEADPPMSRDFAIHVGIMDRLTAAALRAQQEPQP